METHNKDSNISIFLLSAYIFSPFIHEIIEIYC